jgi:hypothetical protein
VEPCPRPPGVSRPHDRQASAGIVGAWPAARRTPRSALWACCPRVARKPTMAFLVAVVATTATSRRHSLSRRWPTHAARFAAICRRQRQLRFGRKQSPTGSPSCRQPLGVPVIDRNRLHDEATRAAARGADVRVATTRLTPRKSCARISRGTLSHGLLQAFAAIGGASRWVAGATIVARSVVLLEVLPEGRSVSAIRADSQKTACRRNVRRE